MNRLRKLRKSRGLTLKELSQKLQDAYIDISADALSKYERGDREPKLQIGEALANYFNVSVSYLLGLDDKAKSNKKIKANIFVWVHNDELTERHEVTDFEIDDNVVIADENGEKWIYPLTSIMGIEVLSNEVN